MPDTRCPKCQGTGWVTRADPDGYAQFDRCPNECLVPQYDPGGEVDMNPSETYRYEHYDPK